MKVKCGRLKPHLNPGFNQTFAFVLASSSSLSISQSSCHASDFFFEFADLLLPYFPFQLSHSPLPHSSSHLSYLKSKSKKSLLLLCCHSHVSRKCLCSNVTVSAKKSLRKRRNPPLTYLFLLCQRRYHKHWFFLTKRKHGDDHIQAIGSFLRLAI